MTIRELNQLRDLKREIQMDAERIAELETQATHITVSLSGMSSGGGDGKRLERYAAAIADLHTQIEYKRQRCIAEQKRLEAYIDDIPVSLTRQIFTLRFIEGLTWQQVANRTHQGSRATPHSIVSRFLADIADK